MRSFLLLPAPMTRPAALTLAFLCALTGSPAFAAEAGTASEAAAYVPGLGEFMGAIQVHHAKLWFAGKAANWPLAAYELDELKETLDDAAHYQPDFKGKPIASLLAPMTEGPLTALEQAIQARNRAAFTRSYDRLSQACNACHVTTDHGFIVIQRPALPPLTNQRYATGRQR